MVSKAVKGKFVVKELTLWLFNLVTKHLGLRSCPVGPNALSIVENPTLHLWISNCIEKMLLSERHWKCFNTISLMGKFYASNLG